MRVLLKIIAIFIAVVLLSAGAFLVYLNVKKNDISRELLQSVNQTLKGDFSVQDISLGSLYSYPNLSVSIKGLKFHAPDGPLTHGEVILEVDQVQLRTDLSEVLKKEIQVNDLFIQKAVLYIERDSLEHMVIAEGFRPYDQSEHESDSTTLKLTIDKIQITDSKVIVIDRTSDLYLPFLLEQVQGDFKLQNNLINGQADIDILPFNFDQLEPFVLNKVALKFQTDYVVDIDKKYVEVNAPTVFVGDEPYRMEYRYDFGNVRLMTYNMSSLDKGVDLSDLFVEPMDTIEQNERIELLGQGQFQMDFRWRPNSKQPFLEAVEASFVLEGKDLKIYGIDLDNVIEKFKRSQEFNLADVSAVMLAGPAGLAVTKGSDFARLAFVKAGDSSSVKHFLADWSMNKGVLKTEDVALSTANNLISTNGWYKFPKDSLDFKINILDKRGCELVGQRVYGDITAPQYSKVNLFKTFFGPVSNFFGDIGIAKCDTLYYGKVLHPKKEQESD